MFASAKGFVPMSCKDRSIRIGIYRRQEALLGSVLLQQNRPREALIEMQRETDNGYRHCGLALALGALGRMSESDSELTNAEKDFAQEKAYWIAAVYSARNEADQAFAWLDRAFR